MFERLTADARAAVATAADEAKLLDSPKIDSGHLLLALLADPTGPAGRTLRACHLTLDDLRGKVRKRAGGLDPDALAAIGIDLDAVRQVTEETFGPGALDNTTRPPRGSRVSFTPDAKKTLEQSLRVALKNRDKVISSGHLLLALLTLPESVAVRALTDARVNIESLRAETAREIA